MPFDAQRCRCSCVRKHYGVTEDLSAKSRFIQDFPQADFWPTWLLWLNFRTVRRLPDLRGKAKKAGSLTTVFGWNPRRAGD